MLQTEARYSQKVAEQVPPSRLHPAIRAVQAELLGEKEDTLS
jgi:hypothetical protein